MNWRRGFNLWHIIMVAINGLLLLAVLNIWWGGGGAPVAVRHGKGPELPKNPLVRDRQPLSAFRLVAAKDLFSQDRAGPEELHSNGQATLEGRQLMGIMMIGSDRVALISNKQKPVSGQQAAQVDVVRQGEVYDGLKVAEITTQAVVFQGKEGKKTLTFPE
ncbi:MAG: hypothetical protein M1438_19705 [Deltaproteobacteria bacterium]|nr:hypothetical protein [Deltaproteobacteria bacterium]